MSKTHFQQAGRTDIVVVELYNDGVTKLEEYRVMIDDEIIAKSWSESKNGKKKRGQSEVGLQHYTLPLWYQRYKKLNEIL